MKTEVAIAICEEWFAHLERQKRRSIEIQELATMARNGQEDEARRRLSQLYPTVYDAGRLEPAVRALVKCVRSANDLHKGD